MGLLLAFIARLITGAQGHWRGCPPMAEQRIYFANHQSHLDWVLIWAALPRELRAVTRPIAARDYWTAGRFRHWLTREVFNAVYVERAPARPAVAVVEPPAAAADQAASPPGEAAPAGTPPDALQPLIDALQAGDSLVMFPEGTRSALGLPQRFRSGLYHLAQRFPEVRLVPAWIDNVQRVMPKGEVVPVPILCTVTFGAPLAAMAGEDKAAFLDRARAAVVALRPQALRGEALAQAFGPDAP